VKAILALDQGTTSSRERRQQPVLRSHREESGRPGGSCSTAASTNSVRSGSKT